MIRNQRGATGLFSSVHHQETRVREDYLSKCNIQNRGFQENGRKCRYMRGSGGPGRLSASAGPSRWSEPAGPGRWNEPAGPRRWNEPAGPGRWNEPAGPGRWSQSAGPGRWNEPAGPGRWNGLAGPGRWSESAGPGRWNEPAGPGRSNGPAGSGRWNGPTGTDRRSGSVVRGRGKGNDYIERHGERDARTLREWQEQRKRREYKEQLKAPVSIERLKVWAGTEDAGQLILLMSAESQKLEDFLKQDMSAECFMLLLKAAACATTAHHHKESIKQLLEALCKAEFLERHLTKYTTDKQEQGSPWEEASEFFTFVLSIIERVLDMVPRLAYTCVIITTKLIYLVKTGIQEIVGEEERIVSSVTNVFTTAKEVYAVEREKENALKRGRIWNAGHGDEPPDNFMDLPVVPTVYDVREDTQPFVRRAVTKGVYEDVNHYLDVQFRLMRQDFILPLKKGINEFKKSGLKKNFSCQDVRVYFNVHIVGTIFDDGLDHLLQFEVLKSVKWDTSKRLMFGSLLCLSKDNFETVIFATVAYREASTLENGFITVKFRGGLDVVFNSTSRDAYIMVETTTFFEMYKPVLEGLKEMATNLPLQDYIIKCKKELEPPKYLLHRGGPLPVYDISCLMKETREVRVPVLTTTKWPPAAEMCLNGSQRDAAVLALTKEIALIQGPPGTGKTYVGLKVMQVLLKNQPVLEGNAEESSVPILVVCYTNHALDQFLEGILEFCNEGIVRVGGRSKSEKLAKYNIHQLRQSTNFRDCIQKIKSSREDCLAKLEVASKGIEKLNDLMNLLEVEIVSEVYLQNVMKRDHFESLNRTDDSQTPEDKTPRIKIWLNSSDISVVTTLKQMINDHLTKLIFDLTWVPKAPKVKKSMNIVKRAKLYQYWVLRYRRSVEIQIQYLLRSPNPQEVRPKLDMLDKNLKITQTEIVSDKRLVQNIFPESFLRFIDQLDIEDHKVIESHGGPVRHWLLGLNNNLHEQLNEIQLLTKYLAGEDITDTFDDTETLKQEEEHRMIGRDAASKAQYESRMNQARSNIISVIDRAESLGIAFDLEGLNSGEWQTSGKPLSFKDIQNRLRSVDAMTAAEEEEVGGIWGIDLTKRFALYKRWVAKYKEILSKKMEVLVEEYTALYNKKSEITGEEHLAIYKTAKVIGMTTTGAARNQAVLQSLGCRVIVVEEAAEVLESHIITALNKNCQHLILIGDHLQLRPKPAVYQLAKDFGLEISLFERLVKNKVPHVVLKEQHRMRPEISRLLRHIYPDVRDHLSVFEYNHVRGITKDIFFINHKNTESSMDDNKSKSNDFEAEYIVGLCKYLLLQGYDPSQITILTTYTGQVFSIKKIMHNARMGLSVTVKAVDDFQGEENDIVLLSLVRSNEENSIGFVKVDNRVCVALSRAKMGSYVIGNFDLMASQSKLWAAILETCQEEETIGEGLTVHCPNHPDTKQVISSSEDFKKCPEGGCGLPCGLKLNCGHVCSLLCHGYDQAHEKFICKKSCTKTCPEKHPCKNKCCEPCGGCLAMVQKVIPGCGHIDSVPCSLSPSEAKCSNTCLSVLVCGHLCSGRCSICTERGKHKLCAEKGEKAFPCGHRSAVECSQHPSLIACQVKCGSLLICGHRCKGTCSDCLAGAIHVGCQEKCRRLLPCGHECSYFCGVSCLPCSEPCINECRHALCQGEKKNPNLCGLPCPPCKKKCCYKCSHRKCSKFCREICDMEICSKKCSRKIPNKNKKHGKMGKTCSHVCSGVCGELCVCAACENICQIKRKSGEDKATLDKECVTEDVENEKSSHRLVLKIPTCSHIFYLDELDEYVRNFDPNGTQYIKCPECSKPILKCMRYETVNKKRSELRDKEKAIFLARSLISNSDRAKLLTSVEIIKQYSYLQDFHYIKVERLSNKVEAQDVSFKLKFAFVLKEIHSLGANCALEKIKLALLKIHGKVSQQQKCEFKTELLRYLMVSCIEKLLLHERPLKQLGEVTNVLSRPRPDLNVMEEAHGLILSSGEMRSEYCHPLESSSLIEDMYKPCLRIIVSSDDEMLCDILCNGPQTFESLENLSLAHLLQDSLTVVKIDEKGSNCYLSAGSSTPCAEISEESPSCSLKPKQYETSRPSSGYFSKSSASTAASPTAGHYPKPGSSKTGHQLSRHSHKSAPQKTPHKSSKHSKSGPNKTDCQTSAQHSKPGPNKSDRPFTGQNSKPESNKTDCQTSAQHSKSGPNKTDRPSTGQNSKLGPYKTDRPSTGQNSKPGSNKTDRPSTGQNSKLGPYKTDRPSTGQNSKLGPNKTDCPLTWHDS